jgi:glycosyltransferase involved in cell wall biosynthesis
VYFHGHSVGGTNPSLVQAMAAGAPILARNTIYNREVLGPEGTFVSPDSDAITKAVFQLMDRQAELDDVAEANVRRAEQYYSWTQVCKDYERTLSALLRD